jgi:hypothetical protein
VTKLLGKKHTYFARQYGIPSYIAKEVNEWMDEPAKWRPGCAHRTERHSINDCEEIAEIIAQKYGEENREFAYNACQLHREKDRESENCGCKPLFEG